MPLIREIQLQKGLLLLWEITEDLYSLQQLSLKIVNKSEFVKLRNPRRQKEWLAVRLLLQHIGCPEITINYNKLKQPLIEHPRFKQISISHSGQLAGILLHEHAPTGLDIENLERDFKKVEDKYLSKKEKELAKTITNGHALFWCAKEAVYKAAGIPGIHFADQIRLKEPDISNLRAELQTPEKIINYALNFFQIDNQLIVYLIDSTTNKQ